jgi:transcriptional regulator with XRE-family HTH domain
VTPTPILSQAAARKLPLHQRIVWARKQKDISQERLAELIGTSRRHMIRIEKGLHHPGPAFRARIAEATEQPEEFFESDDDEEAASMRSQPRRSLLADLHEELGIAIGKPTEAPA